MEKLEAVEKEFKALGTDVYLQLVCAESRKEKAKKDLEAVVDFYRQAEKTFSRFDENSELNYFNNNLGKFLPASAHFLALTEKILYYHKLSEGLFDPRIIGVLEWIGYDKDFKETKVIPHHERIFPATSTQSLEKDLVVRGGKIMFRERMDFAGIAKGYITDTVGEILKQAGGENFLLDSGGDILAIGKDKNGENYRVDVEGIAQEKILVILKDEAIVTSGIGKRKWERGEKRFHHLINPKSPENFSFDLQSVTVVAKNAIEADFWAKVLFILGKEKGQKLSEERKLKSIFLDYRGNAWVSKEIKNNFSKNLGVTHCTSQPH